jgi:predicted DNA-binding transcriptional regulator AlpA
LTHSVFLDKRHSNRLIKKPAPTLETEISEDRFSLSSEVECMTKQSALPPTLPPRLVGRSVAAAYLSISPTTFDVLVEEGLLPRAKRLGGRRKAWDIKALDAAIDQLPDDGEQVLADDQSWDDVDAP